MDHQQIETWIVSGQRLEPDQELSLQSHLSSCKSCRKLAEGWRAVEGRLLASEFAIPEIGFMERWEAHLDRYEQRRDRRQGILTFGGFALGTAVLLALLLTHLFGVIETPTQLIFTMTEQITAVFSHAYALIEIGETLFRTFPLVVMVSAWFGFAALGLLSLLWITSIHRLAFQRRISR